MKNKIILITIILVTISTINAFGISSPYWQGNPLIINAGETKVVNLNLQNMVGEEDITVKAEITQGVDIVSLKQDTFIIKARTSDTIIPLEITIPKNASPENRTIKIDFKKISNDSSGIVIGTGMSVYFDVITTEKRENSTNPLTIGAILLIIILVLIIIRKIRKK